jgi:hypothetical protein
VNCRGKKERNRRGAALIEMTLVGIPIIFVLISVFEISRGMWVYHTSAYAVRDGVRFAQVHGINCIFTPGVVSVNNCPKTIADVTGIIRTAAFGLPSTTTMLTFTPGSSSATATSCYMGSSSATTVAGPYGSLVGCLSLTTTWPPNDGTGVLNGVGKKIQIDIRTPFKSAVGMLWPGVGYTKFAATDLGARSTDYIQF